MFKPGCLPILIGSLPLTNHKEAVQTILSLVPEIPLWPQLPQLPGEGMIRQFLTGFPGLIDENNSFWIDTALNSFEEEMTSFYLDYMQIEENPTYLKNSRFKLDKDTAMGFYFLIDIIKNKPHTFITLKGQITGPITTGTGVTDQNNRSIIYDDNLRDMLVKLLTLRGRWQVKELKAYTGNAPPIIFIDEPGMVSFGSSAFIGISVETVSDAVAEVIAGIQGEGGLAGVHICANGDWGPVLSSRADIISFDGYYYFDNFILFKDRLINFLSRGGILAWGIIPTSDPLIIEKVDSEKLFIKWAAQLELLTALGFSRKQLMEQTFIAPSCGTGSLPPDMALKVITLTSEVAQKAQKLLHNSTT